jgi:hypothetical protein
LRNRAVAGSVCAAGFKCEIRRNVRVRVFFAGRDRDDQHNA